MALNLQDKKAIVAQVKEVAKDALSAVIADSRGVTVCQMNKLRKDSRKINVYMRIIRNTLLRRIVKDTSFKCLKDTFIGPTLIAFSYENAGSAARLFKEFSKVNLKFKIKAAAFEGNLISSEKIDYLATLPTYNEAIIKLIITIKEASIGKLVHILYILSNKKEEE
ncbi:50S ribosomal protein L10 [Serratia symbiotica]|nr:50S ribosomal protein L10 [Serratia symbiotica]